MFSKRFEHWYIFYLYATLTPFKMKISRWEGAPLSNWVLRTQVDLNKQANTCFGETSGSPIKLLFFPKKNIFLLKVWRPIVPDRSDLVTVWHLTDAQHIAKLLYQTFLFLVSLHFWEYYVELQVVVLRRNFQRWQNSLWGCTCFLFK